MYGKLKAWKKHIKIVFHGQYLPYDMYCNATAVLKIDFRYKQSKKYHPQLYVENFKYTDRNSKKYTMSSDLGDDGYFEV